MDYNPWEILRIIGYMIVVPLWCLFGMVAINAGRKWEAAFAFGNMLIFLILLYLGATRVRATGYLEALYSTLIFLVAIPFVMTVFEHRRRNIKLWQEYERQQELQAASKQ